MKRWLALLLLPMATFADPATQRMRIETTAGDFIVELNAARAPLTVANFVRYARSVHRALKRGARRAVSLAYAA